MYCLQNIFGWQNNKQEIMASCTRSYPVWLDPILSCMNPIYCKYVLYICSIQLCINNTKHQASTSQKPGTVIKEPFVQGTPWTHLWWSTLVDATIYSRVCSYNIYSLYLCLLCQGHVGLTHLCYLQRSIGDGNSLDAVCTARRHCWEEEPKLSVWRGASSRCCFYLTDLFHR